MLENFRRWYLRNQNEITWFLIGFLVMAGCSDVGKGDWAGALLSWGIAWVNYYFNKK
jgi:hypothetical protein